MTGRKKFRRARELQGEAGRRWLGNDTSVEFLGMIGVCRNNGHLTLSPFCHWRQMGKWVAQEHIALGGGRFLPSSHCVTHEGSAPRRSTTFLYRLTPDARLAVCDLLYGRCRGRCGDHGHDDQSFCSYYIGIYKKIPRPKLPYEARNKLISYVSATCAYL